MNTAIYDAIVLFEQEIFDKYGNFLKYFFSDTWSM
jgi:hypothetical protein